MNNMQTYESLSQEKQAIAKAMADAARAALKAHGIEPANDDSAARFDEACAVFLEQSSRAAQGQAAMQQI